MKHRYAQEKLEVAVKRLATGSGRIQERLILAWDSLFRLEHQHLPHLEGGHLVEFQALLAQVTQVPNRRDGAIAATCRALSDEDAQHHAERIFLLFTSVTDDYYRDHGRALKA